MITIKSTNPSFSVYKTYELQIDTMRIELNESELKELKEAIDYYIGEEK